MKVLVAMLKEKLFAKVLPIVVPFVAVVMVTAVEVRSSSGCSICWDSAVVLVICRLAVECVLSIIDFKIICA